MDCTSRSDYAGAKEKCLVRAVHYEPNELKIVMDQMLYEERDRIQLCLHSWVTKPIVEKDVIKGVIFESKEGRQAILAKRAGGYIFHCLNPHKGLAAPNPNTPATSTPR